MAQRRMFSKTITESDSFLSMGTDVQNLYFHLGMQADDDGFVSPRRVMKMIGAADDSIGHLIARGFLIPFENGVVVVSAWKENNYIQSDRYKPTVYQQEKAQLSLSTGMYTKSIQDVSEMFTQVRLGKVSKGKDRLGKVRIGKDRLGKESSIATQSVAEKGNPLIPQVIDLFKEINPSYQRFFGNKTQRAATERLLGTHGFEKIVKALSFLRGKMNEQYCPVITTPVQLEEKWAALERFAAKKNLKENNYIL